MASKQLENTTRNPSLRSYYTFMIAKSKLTIQFTQGKIRSIIQTELDINFGEFSSLLQDVSTQAFEYYIQNWPGWNTVKGGMNIEDGYVKFKEYLREKIMRLKEREKEFIMEAEKSLTESVDPPIDDLKSLSAKSSFKVRYPYTLQIFGKPEYLSGLHFSQTPSNITLTVEQPLKDIHKVLVSNNSVLNHPFVNVELNIPMLLHFTRKNVHKIDMFLTKPSDSWSFPPQEHIINIRKFPPWCNIYTKKFMENFLLKLTDVVGIYSNYFQNKALRLEIVSVCNELLKDIVEANLNHTTIQECSEITFHMGSSIYYSDSAKTKDEPINFRKIYNPQMQYSLIYCFVQQNDIRSDGSFKIFDFCTNHTPGIQTVLSPGEIEFIDQTKNCLTYSCTMCNLKFANRTDLRFHLIQLHHNFETIICSKCRCEAKFYEVVNYRWDHYCQHDTKNTENAKK